MTNEIFNRAIQIARRIEKLQEIQNFHSNSRESILTYAHKTCNNDYSLHPSWATNPILSLLAKHDAMIRQEIEQEIESLKKEIENL